jgi:3-phosphoshikimate 1-carboxyvinyltransferase
MHSIIVNGRGPLRGTFSVPGDKSISHRAIMLSSIANGVSKLEGFATGEDCMNTVKAFRSLGVNIDREDTLTVEGKGLHGLKEPGETIDTGNSGTTMRLLLGILAGQSFRTVITGDESLRQRPMRRVIQPLREMGAMISGRDGADFAPLTVKGTNLHPIRHVSPIPSAQVKSAVLLAGLYADGETSVNEPLLSRDHTERMLRFFGAELDTDGTTVRIKGGQELKGRSFNIPGDLSAASFFILGACMIPDSKITITNVGVNPTRTRMIDILRSSGAKITLSGARDEALEPVADITVEWSRLNPFKIGPADMPGLLDEIPALAVAAAFTGGESVIRGASELRVKETDRIRALAADLKNLGADVREQEDGLLIRGVETLQGSEVDSFGDHRIAMAMTIAGMISREETTILNTECINTSFPEFIDTLRTLAPDSELKITN